MERVGFSWYQDSSEPHLSTSGVGGLEIPEPPQFGRNLWFLCYLLLGRGGVHCPGGGEGMLCPLQVEVLGM